MKKWEKVGKSRTSGRPDEGISMKVSDIIHYDVKLCVTLFVFKSNFPIKSYLHLIV